MQIQIFETGRTTIVKPATTRLDVEESGEFRSALLNLVATGHHHLVIDLTDVDFIDSSGLGALVSAVKALKTRQNGGDIRLAGLQAPVVSLLEIIRLHRVFATFPSVDQATESLSLMCQ